MISMNRAGDRVLLEVKVVPSASRTEIVGEKDGKLRVRVAAAPEDGKANLELRTFFAKLLGCSKSAAELVRGEKSRIKTLAFPASAAERLQALIGISDTVPPLIHRIEKA